MFGIDLTASEWAAVIAVAYLAGRVLYGIGRVLWWYVTDSRRVFAVRPYLALATGAVVAAMSIALLIHTVNLPLGQLSIVVYVVTGVLGFFLGMLFEFLLDFRFYSISTWLMAFRVPRYREQLLHGDSAVRLLAAQQLASLGGYAIPARPELLSTFKDESADVRATSVQAVLNSLPDPPPEDDFNTSREARAVLGDPDIRVRVPATAILIVLKAASAEELLPTLGNAVMHPDEEIACTAGTALQRLGTGAEPAIPALRSAVLEREKPNLSAFGALAAIGAPAVPALIEIVQHGKGFSDYWAIDALGKMGEAGRAALPALQALARNSNPMLSGAAKRAIKKLGGA